MNAFSHQQCLNHPAREAVARCPECGGFFCRECITEHDDRVICANCLRRLAMTGEKPVSRFTGLSRVVFCLLGFLITWIFYYQLGRVLLLIPTSFHDGTLWRSDQ
jgi:uncharacterized paraquat-inducible protein A